MPGPPTARVDAIRGFNRFYTRQIGVLGGHLLDSPFSLSEMRVLYELAYRKAPTATDLRKDLGLDAGYLSRMLQRFQTLGLVARQPSPADARQSLLRLTARGRKTFSPLEDRARGDVATLLGRLSATEQRQVVSAMDTIQRLLAGSSAEPAPYVLRPHEPGDMGWIVHRHGAIYAKERGYNEEFEALVARIVADFLEKFDPQRERCWIAEHKGEIVGCVFLVKKSRTVAKLRLLLVEPSARGLGIGRRLVDECVGFARSAGYRMLTLWTQSDLDAARNLYQQSGFRCVHQDKHHSFGQDLVAETWELPLVAGKKR